MSRCLTDRSIDHVVLERGEVANSWKHERWDSLRLLTPNWQAQLPGYGYEAHAANKLGATSNADEFMTMAEVIDFIERYAQVVAAPIQTHTEVRSVTRVDDGYEIATNRGEWQCQAVVVATGACNVARIPTVADALPSSIVSVTPMDYDNPAQLPDGGVLVVGASATGIQLAEEIHNSGRPVTLATGEHVRMPRAYRGKDIQWWLDAAGVLDMRCAEVDDIVRARNIPSPQLVGSADRAIVDLNVMAELGIKLVGRVAGLSGSTLQFSGSLRNCCTLADLKLNRLLTLLDEWATDNDADDVHEPAHRFEPTHVQASPPLALDLNGGEIQTVVWATGYRPDYSWLHVPVLDRKGRIRHDGGVVDSPGMYLMGSKFLRRRKSSFIHGAGDDAAELSEHLTSYLDRAVASPGRGSA